MSKSRYSVAVVVLAVLVASPLMAAEASAQESAAVERARPISAALLLGVGFALGEDFNPWGFGFGLRGGYNLGAIYLGGRFVYHVGTSEEIQSSGLSLADVSFSLWELAAEAGYDFRVAERVLVRPSVVLGVANLITSSDAPVFGESISRSGTDAKMLLSLGATVLYDIDDMWFAGGELRLPIAVGGESVIGLAFYATGGARF